MKLLKNHLLLLALGTLWMACSDEGPTAIDPTLDSSLHVPSSTHQFVAEGILEQVYGFHPQAGTNQTVTLVFEGLGSSLLMSSLEMELVHTESYPQDKLQIASGHFKLRGADGDELFGTYTGEVSFAGPQMIIDQQWTVQGGEGAFQGARGTLVAELKSRDKAFRRFDAYICGVVSTAESLQ